MNDDWVDKCLKCKHSYHRKSDDDILYCRISKSGCRFEEYKTSKKVKTNELYYKVLYTICRHYVNIMDGWTPIPSTFIAKHLDVSVGKVRYQIKKLKADGLVKTTRYGGQTDDGEAFCINGFSITDKAKETDEYKRAYDKERELVKEVFGFDIGDNDWVITDE